MFSDVLISKFSTGLVVCLHVKASMQMYMLVTYGYYVMAVLGFLISVGFHSCIVILHSFAWLMPFSFWMTVWVCIKSILLFKLVVIRWADQMD